MRKIIAGMFAAALAVVVGCNAQSTPGGPGATGKTDRSQAPLNIGQRENTFTLDMPNLETDIKQGESKAVKIGISRGTNFDQDVTLAFGDLPKGVSISPASPTIKAGEKEVQITVEASKDAALGEHTITVNGKPAREGAKATNTFKIQVKKP